MDDLISRQAAVDEVHGAIYDFFDICDDDEESPMTYKDEKLLELNKAITIRIKQLPPAEKTGKWKRIDYADIVNGYLIPNYECSNCQNWVKDMTDYCPNCGAKMEN